MGRMKSLVSNTVTASLRRERRKKSPRRKLYTETERKKMNKLSRLKSKYKKLTMDVYKSFDVEGKALSMQDIRNTMDDDDAREAYYNGYFDEENYDDYCNRDFRTWMLEKGDGDLLNNVIETYETTNAVDLTDSIGDIYADQDIKAKEYLDKYNEINEEMKSIRQKAEDRKTMRKAKELAKKKALKTGEKLIDIANDVDLNKLKKPEQAIIQEAKVVLAKSVVKGLNLKNSNLSDLDKDILINTITATITQNPGEGIRAAIKESVVGNVVKKYGNNAGELADSLVDIATGKGSAKSIVMTAFDIGLKKSAWNPDLLKEKAEELVDSGQSTNDKENIKQLGRDVAIDIAKDVIKSGGQIYAAIPMILKDAFFDIGKAGIRKLKQKD